MAELKAVVINLKSLDQDIQDPILAGGGDANSRSLKIIFTQEAQAQLTPETKVYLKWHHQELDIDGYNIFTQCIDSLHRYNIWEIKWPLAMLHEGNVTCCVELVDSVSIGQTVNFIVRVLEDPHDGSHYIVTDDFTEFQQACIAIATLTENVSAQFETWKTQFTEMAKVVNQMDAKIEAVAATVLPTTITDPTQDQVLKYDVATGKWVNKDESGGSGGTVSWGNISGTLANQTDLNAALTAKANDADVVHTTGNETIGGVKTFSSIPRVATVPTETTELANKNYVDTRVATKQDLLPTATNDYYLHANASTGELEWSPVSGGGSSFTLLTNSEITTIWDEAGV